MKHHRAPMSTGARFRVWHRDGFRCTYCGVSAVEKSIVLEVDHISPVSAGGSNDMDNLTTACRGCNWKKGPHRPRKIEDGQRVTFSWPVHLRRSVRVRSDELGITHADLIRRLLAEALEREPVEVAS